jgi:hypothetical protein
MTLARAVQDGAFKKCCMRTGSYDGSRRNYFFPRLEPIESARGVSGPLRTVVLGNVCI